MAWQDVKNFLYSITTGIAAEPDSICIEILPPLIKSFDDAELKHILDSSVPEAGKGTWKVTSGDLITAINCFARMQPKLKSNYDLRLRLSYSFKLTDPSTKNVLAHQQFKSLFTVYLAKTHVCLPTLFFPYQEASENFWNYIEQIKTYLPFDLDERYLRLAKVKDGNVTSFKKVGRTVA